VNEPHPSAYRPPWWTRLGALSGHLESIIPATLARKPVLPYRRERVPSPDGDFNDLDWIDSATPHAPLVILFHGLEGSSNSHYAAALMQSVKARNWRGAVPHFRGCSGEPNNTVRAYHSGDSEEVARLIRHAVAAATAQSAPSHVYVAGVSLGGNAVLKWLGEARESAKSAPYFVRAAAGISAPLELAAGGHAIAKGFSRVYTRMFLKSLKPKSQAKLARFPQHVSATVNAQAIRASRNLYEFDNAFTAPIHGFRDTNDYWTRASSKQFLPHIALPTLVLNALNDPFVPHTCLPTVDQVSPQVTLEQPAHGGHVGFPTGRFPGTLDWLAQRILTHFDSHHSD
jgi:uncharacterized protein